MSDPGQERLESCERRVEDLLERIRQLEQLVTAQAQQLRQIQGGSS